MYNLAYTQQCFQPFLLLWLILVMSFFGCKGEEGSGICLARQEGLGLLCVLTERVICGFLIVMNRKRY